MCNLQFTSLNPSKAKSAFHPPEIETHQTLKLGNRTSALRYYSRFTKTRRMKTRYFCNIVFLTFVTPNHLTKPHSFVRQCNLVTVRQTTHRYFLNNILGFTFQQMAAQLRAGVLRLIYSLVVIENNILYAEEVLNTLLDFLNLQK